MFEWLKNLPPQAQGSVYGAMIGAAVSILVYILTFSIKDYCIPIILEKRKQKNESKTIFKKYKNPLVLASESLAYRIKEIFENRSYFLLSDAPKTEFYTYKYINTLYRLCCLIGYIRALKLEVLYTNISNNKSFNNIEAAIQNFEKSLADGQEIEFLIFKNICKSWSIDVRSIQEQTLKNTCVQMDNIVNDFVYHKKVKYAEELSAQDQMGLVEKLLRGIEKGLSIKTNITELKTSEIIKEISVKEAYLYRDWQQAIGDMMLQNNSSEQGKHQLIGYSVFENLYNQESTNEKKWISRVEKIFSNLDIKQIDSRFDVRINLLKRVYLRTLDIIIAFKCINTGIEPIREESIKNLQTFGNQLKVNY